jgi:prophage regulatory protein
MIKLLTVDQVKQFVPRGRTTLWKEVKEGRFPQPVRLGKAGIAWRSDEIEAWIDSRERANSK